MSDTSPWTGARMADAAYQQVKADNDRLRAALADILAVDPVDAILDPTRPLRIAGHALNGEVPDAG